jgi:hypothetical protein
MTALKPYLNVQRVRQSWMGQGVRFMAWFTDILLCLQVSLTFSTQQAEGSENAS